MRSDKKDIRKVRLNNLIFGTSTVTTACLYYGLRLGNVIYHSKQEIGLFEAMATSVETIFAQPFVLFPSDWGSVLIFLTVALIADIYMLNEYIIREGAIDDAQGDAAFEGAVYGVYARENIIHPDGKTGILYKAGSQVATMTVDKKGDASVEDLYLGKYYVKEIFAPDGFVTTEEVQEFTFEYAGEDQAEVSYDFTFENQPTTVELFKTDLTTGKELPGAHLKVMDSDGNTVDEWTSTEESHVIKELVVGKEYTITETKPADGYVTAESITFTVENTAEIQKQEMKDDVTKVLISKQDIAGKELPGAKLTILDEDGNVVESWTSTEEAHYIEMLPIGKYTLREETAPEGYLVAKDVEFEVKDTAEVQKVVMVDEEKPEESTSEGGKPSKDVPKTGDNTNLLLWLIVLGMSLSGVVVLGRKIKKK